MPLWSSGVFGQYKRFEHIYISLNIHEFFPFQKEQVFFSSNWHTEEIISTLIPQENPQSSRGMREEKLIPLFYLFKYQRLMFHKLYI